MSEVEQFTELELLIAKKMQTLKIPGLSFGVVVDGNPVFSLGFGNRNLEKNLPFTPDTLYGIASQSKSFCAIAILQLAEQGKLDLDASVNKYIDFQLGKPDKPITVHHLLSHSSGLPDLGARDALKENLKFCYTIVLLSINNQLLEIPCVSHLTILSGKYIIFSKMLTI